MAGRAAAGVEGGGGAAASAFRVAASRAGSAGSQAERGELGGSPKDAATLPASVSVAARSAATCRAAASAPCATPGTLLAGASLLMPLPSPASAATPRRRRVAAASSPRTSAGRSSRRAAGGAATSAVRRAASVSAAAPGLPRTAATMAAPAGGTRPRAGVSAVTNSAMVPPLPPPADRRPLSSAVSGEHAAKPASVARRVATRPDTSATLPCHPAASAISLARSPTRGTATRGAMNASACAVCDCGYGVCMCVRGVGATKRYAENSATDLTQRRHVTAVPQEGCQLCRLGRRGDKLLRYHRPRRRGAHV